MSEQTEQRHRQARRAIQNMKRVLLEYRARMDDELRPKGTTTAQMQVLFAIRGAPGSSGAQLARSCYITPQTMQALLKHLEKAGLIARGKDAVNDRIVTTRITEAGERLAQAVEKKSAIVQAELWEGIADRDLTYVNKLLDRFLVNLGRGEEISPHRS